MACPSDSGPLWATVAGVVYLIAVVFRRYTDRFLIGDTNATPLRVRADGGIIAFALCATLFFGIGLIVLLVRWRPTGSLPAALRPETWGWNIKAVVITAAVRIFLNTIGAWPYRWRWRYDDNVGMIRLFVDNGHGAAYLFLVLLSAVGPAVIEEVFFRYGGLRLLKRWTGSGAVAVIVTAIVFGAMHLGYFPWAAGEAPEFIWNATAAAVLGLALGVITLRRRGRISGPIVIHATLNLVDAAVLLIVAL